MKLDKKKERILEVLADERKLNPSTSLTGLDMKLLGEKVGAYLGIGVMYDVSDLTYSGFVSRKGSKVIITKKGLDYVESQKRMPNFQRLFSAKILVPIVISIIAGLIVAAIMGAFGD